MLRSLGVQLTVRCDMRCTHCFVDLGRTDMPLAWVRDIAEFAVLQGCPELALTGGEPTLHREFDQVLEIIAEHDLRFGLVSNAWGFARYAPTLLEHQRRLSVLDFSLDGAVAATHDANRRAGSFRRVLHAARACRREGLPFGLRFTVTSRNIDEIEGLIDLAEAHGAEHVALIPMQPAAHDPTGELIPSPIALLQLAAGVERLGAGRRTRVGLTTGHFNLELFRPCSSLAEEALYVTARGDLSLCCQLGGYPSAGGDPDVVGNLARTRIGDAWNLVLQRAAQIKRFKRELLEQNRLSAVDYFPCWFCIKRLGKVEWLRDTGRGPWADDLAQTCSPPQRLLQIG